MITSKNINDNKQKERLKKMKKHTSELSKLVDRKLFIAGFTRKEAAKKAGISHQHLSNILVSRSLPSVRVSDVLAELIGEKPERLRKIALKCYEERKARE